MVRASAGLLVLVACAEPKQSEGGSTDMPAPAADFVISAGDSTFWVHTGDHGVSVRGSPLLLAHTEGRFYELYVTDDDRSYQDAVFIGQRLWRRDVVTNDSSVVFADSSIADLARRWALENPGDIPLGPDELENDDPVSTASGEVAVLDVVGPFVSYEWFSDLHPIGDVATHQLRRGVRDLRTGHAVRLAALVGDSAAAAVVAEGARVFRSTTDSLRLAGVTEADYAFDPHSFALVVEGGRPVIAFLAPSRAGSDGELAGLPLPSLPVTPLDWWKEARDERSSPSTRTMEERWAMRQGLELVARHEVSGVVGLVLREARALAGDGSQTGRRSGRAVREWGLGQVTPPVQRIYRLDHPPVAPEVRSALDRAFDDADRYELEIPPSPLPPLTFATHTLSGEGRDYTRRLASLP